jgi:predicted nucleotidyltransferase
VSNLTRGLIEQVQLRFILGEGLDDFQKCFIDSTAVETGSALVLGKRSCSNFSAPHFLSAEERTCTLKRHMPRKRKMSKSAAMGAAKNVAAFLRSLGARRVVLFGSLVTGSYQPGSSDIDLFFEGVPREKESLVAGKALLEFPELPLELRSPGFCEQGFLRHIIKYGSVI